MPLRQPDAEQMTSSWRERSPRRRGRPRRCRRRFGSERHLDAAAETNEVAVLEHFEPLCVQPAVEKLHLNRAFGHDVTRAHIDGGLRQSSLIACARYNDDGAIELQEFG